MAEPAKSGSLSFLSGLLPTAEQLKLVQGIEGQLLRRRRKATLGSGAAILVGVLQVAYAAIQKDFLKQGMTVYQVAGLVTMLAGVVIYLVVRHTSFLIKESSEPFRYTFWVEPFKEVQDTPGAFFSLVRRDRFQLLDYDLREKLNRQIARLSLLNADGLKQEPSPEALASHIQIGGTFAIREQQLGEWVIHVMPRVRIGGANRSEMLAFPVNFPLNPTWAANRSSGGAKADLVLQDNLDIDRYNQLVNRVYSSVATEIYRQISLDIQEKMRLFPTPYLRAVALFNEARDFERSHTIDAYDSAIELYRRSKYCFENRIAARLSRWMAACPVIWRLTARAQLVEADARVGYVKCRIFRGITATLSGRPESPLFATTDEMTTALRALRRLHNRMYWRWRTKRLPADRRDLWELERVDALNRQRTLCCFLSARTWGHDGLRDRQRRSLFTAYVVSVLAYSQLGAYLEAQRNLARAQAADPASMSKDALYLLAAAELEPDIQRKLLKLRNAIELEPDFEIAQYRLALHCDLRLRFRNETDERLLVDEAIREYGKVLRINSGNVGALVGKGYLLWLIEDPEAERAFGEGQNLKAIAGQTFVGDLHYGLARIAAEKLQLSASLALFQQAFAADPGVGACVEPGTRSFSASSYFEYMNPEMLARFEKYNNRIADFASSADISEHKTLEAVRSFVLNDYGNACLVFFHRFGDEEALDKAIDAFHDSIERNPENPIVYFNLDNAYFWRRTFARGTPPEDRYPDCLARVRSLAPQLRSVRNNLALQKLGKSYGQLELQRDQNQTDSESLSSMRSDLKKLRASTTENLERRSGIEAEIEELARQESELVKRTEAQAKALADAQDHFDRELSEALAGILGPTRLSSFEHSAAGVRSMVRAKVIADRFSEEDIDAVKHWMMILAYRTRSKNDLEACRTLADYVFRYYPEDRDTCLCLKNAFYWLGRLPRDDGKPAVSPYDAHCDRVIRSAVSRWLQTDPIHHIIVEYWCHHRGGVSSLLGETHDVAVRQMIETLEAGLQSLDQNRHTYHLRLARLYHMTGKFQDSLRHLHKIVETNPDEPRCCELLGDVYRVLGNAQQSREWYHKAAALNPQSDARSKLAALEKETRRLRQSLHFGPKVFKLLPVATPIAMEIGEDLIPYVAGSQDDTLCATLQATIKHMRRDIQSRLGVKVPGIRFRGLAEDQPRDRYTIFITEVPVTSGTISIAKRFLPGPVAENVPWKLEPAADPVSGDAGQWVAREHWAGVNSKLWEIMDYPMHHLESVLVSRLDEFVGHQEAYNLVEGDAPEHCKHLDDFPAEFTAFTSLLRALLKEQAPVKPTKPIIETFREARQRGLSLIRIVERVRNLTEIRPKLHGNDESYTFCRLGGELEVRLGRRMQQDRLVLSREGLAAFQAAARQAIGGKSRTALVVENTALRPFVKSILAAEFPRLPVLSLRELRSELRPNVTGQIESPSAL